MYFAEKNSKNSRIELKHLSQTPYWHRPGGALMQVIKQMHTQKVNSPIKLSKDYVELYIGSLFGLALQASEGLKIWVSKPKNDPPDFAFMSMVEEGKGIRFYSREIEITRIFGSSQKEIFSSILKKDKNYPKDYILVCLLECNGVIDFKQLSVDIMGLMNNIQHVFIVFHGVSLAESINKKDIINTVSLVQLTPKYFWQEINLYSELDEWNRDDDKLIYVVDGKVFSGLRKTDEKIPNILREY